MIKNLKYQTRDMHNVKWDIHFQSEIPFKNLHHFIVLSSAIKEEIDVKRQFNHER